VARYLLFWGVPTNVGQVTSIRTLEKQIRRLRVSEFQEVRELGLEVAEACALPPECIWDDVNAEPLAPTLARHAEPDEYLRKSAEDLGLWATQNLPKLPSGAGSRVDLLKPNDPVSEIVATLLYPVTDAPFRALFEMVRGWSSARRAEVMDVAVQSRGQRDDMLRGFRGGEYCYDMLIDVGAYRDMHRHRRCTQLLQEFTDLHGYETPDAPGQPTLAEAGLAAEYASAMDAAYTAYGHLRDSGVPEATESARYCLPLATRCRSMFKMDFAEALYISELRSGVAGHYSYRRVAWDMYLAVKRQYPELASIFRIEDVSEPIDLLRR